MRLQPFRTLPLRLRLNLEGLVNRFTKSAAPWLDKVLATESAPEESTPRECYLELEIHPYALVGHQVSSWLAGSLWAKDLDVRFLGGSLSKDDRGVFAFSDMEEDISGRRVKRLRLLAVGDERDPQSRRILAAQVERAKRRFPGSTLVFRMALDPGRWDLVPSQDSLRRALLGGYKGVEFAEKESASEYIAVHVRRGEDIHQNHISGAEGVDRWVLEEWHVAVVEALRAIPSASAMEIRVYGLGSRSDFPLLDAAGVTFCLNGDRDTDLVDLAAARLLVLSPSSFSFTAGLASRSLVVGRVPWWHNIPDEGRWIQIDESGHFDADRVEAALASNS